MAIKVIVKDIKNPDWSNAFSSVRKYFSLHDCAELVRQRRANNGVITIVCRSDDLAENIALAFQEYGAEVEYEIE